jgi:NTF2 fold immunity protein
MRRNTLVACLVGGVLLGTGVAQSVVTEKDLIEYDRRLAENHKTVFPTAGIVPDAETAKSIAKAIAIPIWGEKKVDSELPLLAELKGNVWTVIGNPHLQSAKFGGELIIQLDKRNGAVLSILHTQ